MKNRMKHRRRSGRHLVVVMATEPAPCDLDVYLNAWELRDGTIKHEFNVAVGAIAAATTTVSVGRGITLGGCTSYDATRVFPSSVNIFKIRYTIPIVAQIENKNSLAITELFPNVPIQFSEIFNKAEQYHNGWDWTGSDGIASVKIRRDRIGLNWTESDRIGLKPIELGPLGSNKIEKSRKR
ncbi:hypothetical protein V1477_006941 [Vespula maculifrons]|uniref:Uncharacterized protein n=1 Tax=Vespula maculifrons TaxID=7453 RepID=A0ABD2CH39_VESMC